MSSWLIDYEWKYVERNGVESEDVYGSIELIQVHPVVLAARMAADLRAFLGGKGDEPACRRLVRIHSMIEVPPGVLTDAEERALTGA